MSGERDYVLGTHDKEVERLGLQHRVWRERALDAWHRAGFRAGQTIIDVGCGPGYASLDLSGLVGESGTVIAIDKSRRFLDALDHECRKLGVRNIRTFEIDLDDGDLPVIEADGAWSRWAFAFVRNPRALLRRVCERLRPTGTIVFHEYFDYRTWRLAPRSPGLEEFVQTVMRSWRESGGEPDIALDLPVWLLELGFEIRGIRPIMDIVDSRSFVWQWPREFLEVGLDRMVELGQLSRKRADEILHEVEGAEQRAGTLMITPAVMELIAMRRDGMTGKEGRGGV
jgi:SAM-dependent methyltransferase